jgi:hypothetical protein
MAVVVNVDSKQHYCDANEGPFSSSALTLPKSLPHISAF